MEQVNLIKQALSKYGVERWDIKKTRKGYRSMVEIKSDGEVHSLEKDFPTEDAAKTETGIMLIGYLQSQGHDLDQVMTLLIAALEGPVLGGPVSEVTSSYH